MKMNIDLIKYTGIGQFGPAYQIMLENDAHAQGSVDRVLVARMIRICLETAEYLYTAYTPIEVKYQKGSRPELERYVNDAVTGCKSDEDRIRNIASFCSRLSIKVENQPLDDIIFGGTEEEIIQRGSDFCTDIARVGCTLCQVAGIPARIVFLADTAQAYSGHVLIEAYRNEFWGTVDTSTNVIYQHPDGKSATTWDLMNNPRLIEAHQRSNAIYTNAGQFRSTAISNYFIWKKYDYTVSTLNDYYLSILEMSDKGWIGGLRWLHGEDKVTNI